MPEDMLYEAIYQAKEAEPLPRSIIKNPEPDVYIDGFGNQKDDYCLVGILDGKIV